MLATSPSKKMEYAHGPPYCFPSTKGNFCSTYVAATLCLLLPSDLSLSLSDCQVDRKDDWLAMSDAGGSELPPSQRLEGKVALVTGGASGIGESITRLFRHHGAKVCVADVQDNLGHLLCESLGGDPYASFVHCDVTIEEDMSHAVDFTVNKYNTIDVMVNNAGISGNKVSDIRDLGFDEFKRIFDVNVHGVFLGMKHASRVMIPRKKGSIISLSSVSSIIGGLGPHGYTASKHAVVGLTKNVAAELGRHGIRVNSVAPYAVPTSLSMGHLPESERTEDLLKAFLTFAGSNANLKGVDLTADDVARAVLYLASDDSKYVSGLNLTVDGGFTSVNNSLRAFE